MSRFGASPMDLMMVMSDKAMHEGDLAFLAEIGEECRVYTLGFHYGGVVRRIGGPGLELADPHVVFDDDPAVGSYGTDTYKWPGDWIRISWPAVARIDTWGRADNLPKGAGELESFGNEGERVMVWQGAYPVRGVISRVGHLGLELVDAEFVAQWPASPEAEWTTREINGVARVPWHAILAMGELNL